MRTGVSYMGHYHPKHIQEDLKDISSLGCSDLLVALQENDFAYFPGKLTFIPKIAGELGLKPIAIFWGALNLFGGGRSSQHLLEYPEGHQIRRNRTWDPAGCYNNPRNVAKIREMIDRVVDCRFEGYFIDEPTLLDCYCHSCRCLFEEWFKGNLEEAVAAELDAFRRRSVINYIQTISAYIKGRFHDVETQCCVMPVDKALWKDISRIPFLDSLGTDIYWTNSDRNIEEMTPLVRELDALCVKEGKIHHEWLQCWDVHTGREQRIAEQGRLLIKENPDALYIWAYNGQMGTSETCDDPEAAWGKAVGILRQAISGL